MINTLNNPKESDTETQSSPPAGDNSSMDQAKPDLKKLYREYLDSVSALNNFDESAQRIQKVINSKPTNQEQPKWFTTLRYYNYLKNKISLNCKKSKRIIDEQKASKKGNTI